MRRIFSLFCLAALGGCATVPRIATEPVEVQVLAFNDFHGNLEVPPPVEVIEADGSKTMMTSGGAAFLGAAIARLRQANSVTVSAGDTIGATPLTSALFLDEPTIEAMNQIGLEFNAVGNHEFDKGLDELKRMQAGGCAKHGLRDPCAVEPFRGARFTYLGANVIGANGEPVLPTIATKRFGTGPRAITLGFIGMTLRATSTLVTPAGIAGLRFADEAATANALVPKLKAQGADAIVLLIHQGGKTPKFTRGQGCEDFAGDIVSIIPKLDPAITTIVSGHTHWAYVCHNGAGGTHGGRLLTSAGKSGIFLTDIRLSFNPATRRLISQRGSNSVVGTGENGEHVAVRRLVDRYVAAAAPLANKVVGRLTAIAPRNEDDSESPAANLIADSYLAATRSKTNSGAQIALVNATGVRVALPAGEVRYRDAFAMMPFGNNLLVMTLTGAQLRAVFEQQYSLPLRSNASRPAALVPSEGLRYRYDLARPAGERIVAITLDGVPIDPARRYRVVVNNYLASGGDGLSGFKAGTDVLDAGIVDIDALIAWISSGRTVPAVGRVIDVASAVPAPS